MFCGKCGNKNEAGARFCWRCGASIKNDINNNNNINNRNNNSRNNVSKKKKFIKDNWDLAHTILNSFIFVASVLILISSFQNYLYYHSGYYSGGLNTYAMHSELILVETIFLCAYFLFNMLFHKLRLFMPFVSFIFILGLFLIGVDALTAFDLPLLDTAETMVFFSLPIPIITFILAVIELIYKGVNKKKH